MEIKLKQPYSFCQPGKRSNQEDARFPDQDAPVGFPAAFIVCDGVGGQDKGEVASRTVADALGKSMENFDSGRPFGAKSFSKVLDVAYDKLERAMTRETDDMATTMTFVAFHSDGVFCAHMGDSRIYHVRPGVGILYQSDDHSLVNVLVHSGNLTPEEAIDHPRSNVITRCMAHVQKGETRPGATTVQLRDIEAGDYFFLCSDGVVHCVPDDILLDILSSPIDDRRKLEKIARLSKDSDDNNTAYLIGIEKVSFDSGIPEGVPGEHRGCSHESEDSSNTEKIPAPDDIATEISPCNAVAGSHKISNFFKKLFT